MAQKLTKISGSKVKFPLTITQDDFSSAQKKVIAHHKSEVSAKGFRKGHAPDEVVIAHIGPDRLAQTSLDQALTEVYRAYALEHQLRIIGRPDIDFPKKMDFPFEVSVTVEVFPEVTVKDYKNIKVKPPKVDITDKEVEEVLETLLAQYVSTPAPGGEVPKGPLPKGIDPVERAAKKGDLIEADFAGKDDQGNVLPNTNLEKNKFRIGMGHYLPDLEKAFEGMKAGESKEKVPVAFPKDYHSKDFAGKKVPFDIKLHSVYEINPQNLDEAGVEQIMGKKESPEDFRKTLRDNIASRKRQQLEQEAIQQYQSDVAKRVKGDLPQSWIDREVEAGFNRVKASPAYQQNPEAFFKMSGGSEASFRKDMAKRAEENLRSYLGLSEIVDQEGITLDKEEDAQVEKEATSSENSATAEEIRQNRRIDKYLRALMLEDK